ncbi:AAA family ATPase [Hydrogenophaga borbori]|uniref:AAA family ATPase n=1 Tax=Hydrogenophaga borbori TaxID=2294117 RepID=UPI00301BA432
MNQANEILILTGTPGAGKTTTAKALAETSGSPKVHLHCDDFWHFIRHGAIPPFLESAHKQNETVVKVLAQAAEGYAKGGYFVIVDGVVGPWFLEVFTGLSVRLHYIVLQIDVESAIARCQSRGGDTLTDAKAIASLHRQLSSLGVLSKHALDVRGLSPELTLAAVIAAVESEKFLLNA